MKDYIKLILIISIGIISEFCVLFVYPAYASYCSSQGTEAIFSKYLISGSGGYYIPSNGTIVILDNSTNTLRHELCHMHYNSTVDSFKEELSCYIQMWFIWKKVNLTTLDYG